ncbi:MAG TPA: glycosyltransferase [Candidatus Methylomirabilis sp.]|nr:glycosyltransferase [Candidatus Methylomirabilis sp.]
MEIEFCLPIYNEEKILAANSGQLFDFCRRRNFPFSWRIILIVNGSTDRSLAIAKSIAAGAPESFLTVEEKEKGRGRALKKYWQKSHADILVYMDADLATSLDNISDLLSPLLADESDLVIGSRLLAKSKIERPLFREFISQSYNLLSRLILRHKFSDLQCGFKAIKRETFLRLAPYLESRNWFFDTELIMLADFFHYRIKEIPVVWEEGRWEQRHSKVNVGRDSLAFLLNLLRLKIRLHKIR